MTDLASVLSCIPGASLGAATGEREHEASITLKAAEFQVSFAGSAALTIESERTAVVQAKGRDRTGAIQADAKIHVTVEGTAEDESVIDLVAQFDFSGVLAPAARAGGKPAAIVLMREFANRVTSRLSSAP